MTRTELLAALTLERYGPPPLHDLPRATTKDSGTSRLVCVGCGAPAHPGPGWHCPICAFSAYQTAPEVVREVS